MSITASWLIIAVIIARLLIRKAPKWISCLLGGFVMIRLIFPFSFESSLSVIPSKEVIPQDIAMSESPAISTGVPAINSTLNPIIMESLAPEAGGSVNPLQIWTAIGSWIWIAGIIVMLAYALVSYLKLRKQVAASVPLRDKVMVCDEVKSPFILGVFRPMIYVPSDLTGDSLEYVLSHEKAHLERKDHLWKPLGYLILTVYWFNPLCWAAYVLLSRDIEMACDEKVIRDMDREQTAGYSQALLNASYHVRGVRACPVAFGEVSVKQRVKGVLNYKKPAFWVIVVALILCVALGVTLLTDPADNAGGSAENAGDGYKVAYLENDIWEADGFMDKMLNPDMMAISSIEGCPLFRIDTMDDLEDFRSMIGKVADTSIDSEGMQSFDEAVEGYDEEFFAKNSLLLAYVSTSNEKFDVVLEETAVKETYFYMFVERTGEQNAYSDHYWPGLIIKEVVDQDLTNVRSYVAQYGKNMVFGPYAADTETAVKSGLDNLGVKYRDMSIKDQILTVNFDSEGEDHVTLDDVRSLGQVLKAAHSYVVSRNIWELDINFYGKNGDLIFAANPKYDWQGDEYDDILAARGYEAPAKGDFLAKVEDLISGSPLSYDSADIDERTVEDTLELTVRADAVNAEAMEDASKLYSELADYERTILTSSFIDLTVLDPSGDVLGYITGDTVTSTGFMWSSPEIEEDLINNEGRSEVPESTGTFIKPVDADITKGFGENSGKMHNGVDFAAEEGTPILAADGGTVVTADWVSAYGNCVEIDHGDGVVTRYAHCSKLLVSEGDSVSQGQTIAEVGSTGVSTGPHCHFEMIVNGEAVDPVPKMDLEG